MNYNKKTVKDVEVSGKKVLLRCDFNVPQDKETGAITSDKRIVAALPTIQYLLEQGAAVTMKNLSKGLEFKLTAVLTQRQRQMVLAGGLLQYTKASKEA